MRDARGNSDCLGTKAEDEGDEDLEWEAEDGHEHRRRREGRKKQGGKNEENKAETTKTESAKNDNRDREEQRKQREGRVKTDQ